MDILSPTLQYLADKSKKLTSKAILVLSVLVILILADNIFGYTYYNNNSKKIEQVKEINSLLKDSSLPENIKQSFIKLRQQIVSHKTVKDYLYDFFTNISFSNNKNSINPKASTDSSRSSAGHFVSSSWVIILLMIFILLSVLEDDNLTIDRKIISILFAEVLLYSIAILLSKLLYLIPIINNTPTINYIINALICFIVVYIPFQLLSKFLSARIKKLQEKFNEANG